MKGQRTIGWAAALLLALPLAALEVDEAELKSAGGTDSIVFVNYTGPHARIDSLASIKRLGADLGASVAEDAAQPRTAGTAARYSVIHAVGPAEAGRLDADIILIGGRASVDHVDNLRHIIASYLSAAYGYSERDASTLAVFATVYNAVYRGNLGYFQDKYKQAVASNLSAQDCGLALNYKEWPGRTQIVIPLYDVAQGGISTVDTSVISDSQVVKHMQDEEGKNIESRKDMVDLKEREAEEASERAQEAQKAAVEEQAKLDEEKQKTEELRKEAEAAKEAADEAQKEADEAQKAADENPGDRQAQQEAAEKQEAAAEKQEELEQKQEELEQQEAAEEEQRQRAEEARQEAAGQQEFADRKNAEAQDERRSIAGDQQAVLRQEMENAAAPAAYAIELTDESSMLSGMIKVNTNTGAVIKSSPVTYIRNRTMFQAGENYIAIAGENSGNGAVKLVLLSPDTMEIAAESAETVAETSVLVQDGGDFYCVIQNGGSWVLAKYDQNLALKLTSPVPVKSGTPVTVAGSQIVVTGADGTVHLLNKSDLKDVNRN